MTKTEEHYHSLLEPSPALLKDIAAIDGDIMILGAGGKMGPALAELLAKTVQAAGINKKIAAASRFSEAGLKEKLDAFGITTYAVDLLDDQQLQSLPEMPNLLYLAGQKFGTTGKESFTWAMNSYLPARVGEKYKNSRIVAFSTGNVYPLSPVAKGGLDESNPPAPLGEYAQSCLGRERLFEYISSKYGTKVLLYRLNYAIDLSYGVLLEIAKKVKNEEAIDIRMGHVNVIWQGDANEMAIRSLLHCSNPPAKLNITGPETVAVEWIAEQFGQRFGKEPVLVGEPAPTALLSNAAKSFGLFGYPRVSLLQMIDLTTNWLLEGGATVYKPTHFQEREGRY
ncbi:NAD-dependent epimerase/dehydratase family protein [Flavihumibacter sp. UBA7668]|uniref:NAD-dependent epimerase/dehydratase family protein n=1 Tax=Flavihumibacter sp. UBA7668 TaxID=1946542 RepID=UPI0025BDDBBC|nr:NAD-dependent epimerase/dehydratase family protein [Flavihumibacter sp. UBA7668]